MLDPVSYDSRLSIFFLHNVYSKPSTCKPFVCMITIRLIIIFPNSIHPVFNSVFERSKQSLTCSIKNRKMYFDVKHKIIFIRVFYSCGKHTDSYKTLWTIKFLTAGLLLKTFKTPKNNYSSVTNSARNGPERRSVVLAFVSVLVDQN